MGRSLQGDRPFSKFSRESPVSEPFLRGKLRPQSAKTGRSYFDEVRVSTPLRSFVLRVWNGGFESKAAVRKANPHAFAQGLVSETGNRLALQDGGQSDIGTGPEADT